MTPPETGGTPHGLTPEDFATTPPLTQPAIDTAVATIRRLAGWHIWPVIEETITISAPGDKLVFLPTKHLIELKALSVDGVPQSFGPEDASPDGTVWVDSLTPAANGRPRRVTATIVHGYHLPREALALVGAMAARASAPAQSVQVGRINIGAPGAVTPQAAEWRLIDELKLGPLP